MCVSLLKSNAFLELSPFRCVCVIVLYDFIFIVENIIYTTHMSNIDTCIVCHKVLLKEHQRCLIRREFIIKKVVVL